MEVSTIAGIQLAPFGAPLDYNGPQLPEITKPLSNWWLVHFIEGTPRWLGRDFFYLVNYGERIMFCDTGKVVDFQTVDCEFEHFVEEEVKQFYEEENRKKI